MTKIKILTLGDHPFSPSGVGIQTKNMVEGLLDTGKYSVVSLAGAVRHHNSTPIVTEKWGDDWKIFPVGGSNQPEHIFGTPEIVRSVLRTERPDIVWFMTDPHWYKWLWQIEDEIRPLAPMVYYHVWDNYPAPHFNKSYYDSTDCIVTISKLTDEVVSQVSDTKTFYLPHAVDTNVFKKISDEKIAEFKASSLGEGSEDKVVYFWNNRNCRRKQGASVLWWFSEFLEKVGKENACLIMHTDPNEPKGADLAALLHTTGLTNGEIMISTTKYPAEQLAAIYNMADCTINIADAEGFGLSTLESLACETPIIANLTGGLKEQVTDGETWFGVGIEPATTTLLSSKQVPYLNEDRVSKEDFISALETVYHMDRGQRRKFGILGRQHVINKFNFETYKQKWDEILTQVYEESGSWESRKNYNSWGVTEL